MLGTDSPGFRARVALVEHPEHGRSVCKIFRPGAMTFFHRELHARRLLADQPLMPRLLEHGPNWLLTPEYADEGTHRLRRLPGIPRDGPAAALGQGAGPSSPARCTTTACSCWTCRRRTSSPTRRPG